MQLSLRQRPSCPTVLIPFRDNMYALPIQKLKVEVEFNVSTAFVKLTGRWKNNAKFDSDCMFVLPLNGVVTNVNVEVSDRMYETHIIPADVAAEMAAAKVELGDASMPLKAAAEEESTQTQGYDEYIPNLYRLPIAQLKSKGYLTITVNYIEPLKFFDAMYHFTLPLKFDATLIPKGKTMDDVISISCAINSVSHEASYRCASHSVEEVGEKQFGRVQLKFGRFHQQAEDKGEVDEDGAPKKPVFQSVDWKIEYTLSSQDILPTLITEHKPDDPDGTFILFVTPPSIDNVDDFFSRNMIFLLDKSGSMGGSPYQEALRALNSALDGLKATDKFTIVSFDHKQKRFSEELENATPSNIQNAKDWANQYQPDRGGTDIQTPLEWAVALLEQQSGNGVLPFVVLMTDGCVEDERAICKFVDKEVTKTRILTFGIGSYCNWFFLKMLAQIGRGFSDVVVYKEKIFSQMNQLLNMAAVPVITNMMLELDGVENAEVYPFPLPDLFMGAPLAISGKYTGEFPDSITLNGTLTSGEPYAKVLIPRQSDVIPVTKVFIKQRLDLLTAKCWLEDEVVLREEVVNLSCEEQFPSAHTTMILHEKLLKHEDDEGDEADDSDSEDEGDEGALKKKKKWYTNPKLIAAIAVGSVAVGALAFSFGDLAGTAANLPGLGELGLDLGGCCDGDCDCDCDCDCGECLAC